MVIVVFTTAGSPCPPVERLFIKKKQNDTRRLTRCRTSSPGHPALSMKYTGSMKYIRPKDYAAGPKLRQGLLRVPALQSQPA